jgi:hypothetical protein
MYYLFSDQKKIGVLFYSFFVFCHLWLSYHRGIDVRQSAGPQGARL